LCARTSVPWGRDDGASVYRWFLCLFVLLLIGGDPTHAVESISVGEDGSASWVSARETSRFVSVRSDRIWMWNVTADGNLARGIEERGGGVFDVVPALDAAPTGGPGAPEPVEPIPGGDALVDGEASTYFDPDLMPLFERQMPIIIDLGAAFSVNRVRLFPRLDRINRNRFLQEFSINGSPDGMIAKRLVLFQAPSENSEPVVDVTFEAWDVRYLELISLANRPWEVAEIEVYGDGSAPVGEYVSQPLPASQATPVWGRLRIESGEGDDRDTTGSFDDQANLVIQTRTGPDPSPLLYYMLKGDELIPVTKVVWEGAVEGLKGPVDPNPDWSVWETVTDGLIRSPSLNRYLQFRIGLPEPGTILRRLHFEYSHPPIAQDLAAEISPTIAEPGVMTPFALSLQALLKTTGVEERRDTGFRQLQVRTSAQIGQVLRVLVDDEEIFATTRYEPGQGFTINLWDRQVQNGTFFQIEFTAAVLRERTRFEIRALDRRTELVEDGDETEQTTAYQVARAADIDEVTPGGSLTVRLAGGESLPLVANLSTSPVVTPNGDGIRDQLAVHFSLLKLIAPARVSLDVHDLSGRRIHRAYDAEHVNGILNLTWGVRDESGRLLTPGIYVYRLTVEADSGDELHQGVFKVAY
jgi:hypothetical protein